MAQRPRKAGIDVEAAAAADLWVGQPLGSPSTLIPGAPVAGNATLSPGSMTVRSDAADRQRRMIAATVLSDAPFSIGDLAEARVPGERAPASPTPRKRVVRPKTKLGRAFLTEGAAIVLQTQSMISIVDGEIVRLHEQKRGLNDPDHIDKLDAPIANLDALKKGLINLQSAAVDFPREKVDERTLGKVIKGFKEQFDKFWKKDGAELISDTAKVTLCCSGFVLAYLVGMPVSVAAVIGCIPAHKEISEVLKASKGLFNILGRSS